MFQWLREYLELKSEFRERNRHCESCEILKQVNDQLRMDNEKLLRRVLEKPEPEVRTEAPEMRTMPLKRHLPWRVKQQMLEAEDRERAKAMRNAAQPDTVEDLEKELDLVAAEREAQSGTTTNSSTGSQ